MRRREFLGVLGGAATTWPLAARAQQTERVRRIGALLGISAGDPEAPPRVAAFLSGLHDLGWDDGRNIKIELRFAGSGGAAAKPASTVHGGSAGLAAA